MLYVLTGAAIIATGYIVYQSSKTVQYIPIKKKTKN